MRERSEMIEWIRSELVGPSRPLAEPYLVEFSGREFIDSISLRRGPVVWQPDPDGDIQEVLYFERESPHRKYGAGLLHPATAPTAAPPPDQAAMEATDTIGAELDAGGAQNDALDGAASSGDDDSTGSGTANVDTGLDASEDFEVTSPDVRHPSTIGISFCAQLEANSHIIVLLPKAGVFHGRTRTLCHFS